VRLSLFSVLIAVRAFSRSTSYFMEVTTGNDLLDLVMRCDARAATSVMHDARLVVVEAGRELQRKGEPVHSCYFPTRGVLAMACDIGDGVQVNTLRVGFDGAIHASVGLDIDNAYHDVVSCLPGQFWEIGAARWHSMLDKNPNVRRIAAKFTDLHICLLHRALACQIHHDLESRFCRCLLELYHWQRGRPLAITHQRLSRFLGVRRATISLMAQSLEEAGIIACARSTINVSDVYALVQASCPCHGIIPPSMP
jgi:CRP-like cAMP-binding protein